MTALPISIQIGQEAIVEAESFDAALLKNRGTALAADVLIAYLFTINKGEALRIAKTYN